MPPQPLDVICATQAEAACLDPIWYAVLGIMVIIIVVGHLQDLAEARRAVPHE